MHPEVTIRDRVSESATTKFPIKTYYVDCSSCGRVGTSRQKVLATNARFAHLAHHINGVAL